jgi:hypothetical protein
MVKYTLQQHIFYTIVMCKNHINIEKEVSLCLCFNFIDDFLTEEKCVQLGLSQAKIC